MCQGRGDRLFVYCRELFGKCLQLSQEYSILSEMAAFVNRNVKKKIYTISPFLYCLITAYNHRSYFSYTSLQKQPLLGSYSSAIIYFSLFLSPLSISSLLERQQMYSLTCYLNCYSQATSMIMRKGHISNVILQLLCEKQPLRIRWVFLAAAQSLLMYASFQYVYITNPEIYNNEQNVVKYIIFT